MYVDVLIGQNFTELNDIHYEKSDTTSLFSSKMNKNDAGVKLNQNELNIGAHDHQIFIQSYSLAARDLKI